MPVRRMLAVLVTDVGTEDWPAVPRAKAVTTWLVEHGVATATLSSKGYGKSPPVAAHDSDLGRAMNRRIEIVRTGCSR